MKKRLENGETGIGEKSLKLDPSILKNCGIQIFNFSAYAFLA